MKLYLMRHGEAVSEKKDPNRPLSEFGQAQISEFGKNLKSEQTFALKKVYHSGKMRAQETAEIVSRFVAPELVPELHGGLKPNDSVDEFVLQIDLFTMDTLLVSHLPFLGLLSLELTGQEHLFSTGKMICLEKQTDVAHPTWKLLWEAMP